MQLQNIIVVLGPPGSGKGTQSRLLVDKLRYAYFSMGDTLREYAKRDNDLGRLIKNTIERGVALPDRVVKQVFEESFEKLTDQPGVIIEGYPRSLGQVEVLKQILEKFHILKFKVIFLDVEKKKLLQRLALRKTCPNCQAMYLPGMPEYNTEICTVCGHKIEIRKDDTDINAVEKRFEEYKQKTATAKKYYEDQGQLIHINGDQPIEDVHKEIMGKL